MIDISIVIVNYNTHEHLRKCIDSIIENHEIINIEIIVVDNDSSQKEIKEFPSIYPDVRFLFLENNYGFGFGCNRGVELATGKYILLLNPDIIVTKNSILGLFNYAEKSPDVACYTGLLMYENNVVAYCFNNFPDIHWEMMEAFGVGAESVVNKMLEREEILSNVPFDIDWAHGACIMIRRNVFEMVKGFDENIFLYYEDIDIQKKIKDKGYRNVCIPSSRFYHFERSSVRDLNSQKVYYFYMHKSKKYYLSKYFSKLKRFFIIWMYILAYSSKIVMLPFRKKFKGEKLMKLNHYFLILGVYTNLIRKI